VLSLALPPLYTLVNDVHQQGHGLHSIPSPSPLMHVRFSGNSFSRGGSPSTDSISTLPAPQLLTCAVCLVRSLGRARPQVEHFRWSLGSVLAPLPLFLSLRHDRQRRRSFGRSRVPNFIPSPPSPTSDRPRPQGMHPTCNHSPYHSRHPSMRRAPCDLTVIHFFSPIPSSG
jgi:hypothetical protein